MSEEIILDILPNELIYIIGEFLSVQNIFVMRRVNKLLSELLFNLIFEKITFKYCTEDQFGTVLLKHNIVFPGNITYSSFKYFYKHNEKSDELVKDFYPNVQLIDQDMETFVIAYKNMLFGMSGLRYSS
jgi:hypothetical protein